MGMRAIGLVPPWGFPISTIILYKMWEGHVACSSTCSRICPNSLRAVFGRLLRSAGDHRSIPTAVAVFKT
eukprot:5715449-Karenia_brevis.AAC.1